MRDNNSNVSFPLLPQIIPPETVFARSKLDTSFST